MMYRAQVEAVNGLSVRAGGKWLMCIGNAPVKAGDRVWTDGHCVFGNHRVPQQPFVPVSQTEDLIIPIVYEDNGAIFFSDLKSKGSLSPIKNERQISPSTDTDYYFTAGGKANKKLFAAVDVAALASGSKKYVGVHDMTITADDDIYTAFFDGKDYDHYYASIYKNSELVWTPYDVISSLYPGYYKYAYPWNESWDNHIRGQPMLDAVSVYTMRADIDGNFYCIADVCFINNHSPGNENTFSTWDEHFSYFFIENDKCTLLSNAMYSCYGWGAEAAAAGRYPPPPGAIPWLDDGTYITGSAITQPFAPYSVYLPCKNEGKGGWYSFDFTSAAFPVIRFNFNIGYSILCQGIKVFNKDRDKLLFELTKDDWESIGITLSAYELPDIDFCQLGTDDYLILFRTSSRSFFSVTQRSNLLRYKNKRLSVVKTNIDASALGHMCAVSTTRIKEWRSAVKKLSSAMLKSKANIVV